MIKHGSEIQVKGVRNRNGVFTFRIRKGFLFHFFEYFSDFFFKLVCPRYEF